MTTLTKPAVGDERIMLRPKGRGKKQQYRVTTEVWTEAEGQFSNFWDEDAKDWVHWPGSWTEVQTLTVVDSIDEAKAFLTARAAASSEEARRDA